MTAFRLAAERIATWVSVVFLVSCFLWFVFAVVDHLLAYILDGRAVIEHEGSEEEARRRHLDAISRTGMH